MLFLNKHITWDDDSPFLGNQRNARKHHQLHDEDDLLLQFDKKDFSPVRKNKPQPLRLKKKKCSSCDGTGTMLTDCVACSGKGQTTHKLGGRQVFKETCSACSGFGKSSSQCRKCNGEQYIFSEY